MDIEVRMPDIGVEEVEVIEILVKINQVINLEQSLITVEGEKASMEVPSPITGIVKNIYIKIGDKIKSSSLIMTLQSNSTIHNENQNNKLISSLDKNYLNQEKKILDDGFDTNLKKNTIIKSFVHASPFIRRLARNLNINLSNVTGTGRKDRILKEDLELYQKTHKLSVLDKNINFDTSSLNENKTEEIELSSIQKITGDNLYKNWINIPHVTQFDEVNITALEKFRKKYNSENKNGNNEYKNITILPFIIKVVSRALEKFPIFNSSLASDNKKITLKKYINIGIAVAVDSDLFVPVLKNVHKKNIEELFCELKILLQKAKNRKLTISDTIDGCFTISSLGGIGGNWFSPIINAPEVAILGVSKSQIKPLWNEKEFIPSLMLPLSLSYNHRVINGADAARFITFIGKLLSDMHFLLM